MKECMENGCNSSIMITIPQYSTITLYVYDEHEVKNEMIINHTQVIDATSIQRIEVCDQCYDIYVNGNKQESRCIDCSNINDMHIECFHSQNKKLIIKAFKQCNQDLFIPDQDKKYTLCLSGMDDACIQLSKENDFSICIDQICAGEYVLSSDLPLEFVIDHFHRNHDISFSFYEQDVIEVWIIDHCVSWNTSCLHIVLQPYCVDQGCNYILNIYHHDVCDTFILKKENQFQLEWLNIACGIYRIQMECSDDREFQYCLHDSKGYAYIDVHVCDTKKYYVCISENQKKCAQLKLHGNFLFDATNDDMMQGEICSVHEHIPFCLNNENQYIQEFCDLPFGIYELYSHQENLLFRLPNQEISKKGVLLIDRSRSYEVEMIFLKKEAYGSINIRLYATTMNGIHIKPNSIYSSEVMIYNDAHAYHFVLCDGNDWSMCLDQIPCGQYYIDWNVENGMICIHHQNLEGNIIYVQNETNLDLLLPFQHHFCLHVQIDKYNTEMIDFDEDACFEICLEDEYEIRCLIANRENDYCVCFDHLDAKQYRIVVEKDGYRSYYMIDDVCYEHGYITLKQAHTTMHIKMEACVQSYQMLINMRSFFHDELLQGRYHLQLKQAGICHSFVMNETNDYDMVIDDVSKGLFHLQLNDPIQYDLYINGIHSPNHEGCIYDATTKVEIIIYTSQSIQIYSDGYPIDLCLEASNERNCFTLCEDNQYIQRFALQNNIYRLYSNQNFLMEINGYIQNQDTFIYDGQPLEIHILHQGLFIYDQDQREREFSLKYKGGKHQICLNEDNHYMKYFDCDTGMVELCDMDDYDIYVNDEKITSSSFELKTPSTCTIQKKKDISKVHFIQEASCSCELKDISIILKKDEKEISVNIGKDAYIELAYDDYEIKTNDYVLVCNGKNIQQLHVCEAYMEILVMKKKEKASGSIDVCLYGGDQEYVICLKSSKGNEHIVLGSGNHYYGCFQNVEDGWYEIILVDHHASYIVNGEKKNRAHIHIQKDIHHVDIHLEKENGSITINAYYIEDGILKKIKDKCFIQISHHGKKEQIELNEGNDYAYIHHDIDNGMYEIKDLSHENVSYIVDGKHASDTGYIDIQGNSHIMQIIIPQEIKALLSIEGYSHIKGGYENKLLQDVSITLKNESNQYDIMLYTHMPKQMISLPYGMYDMEIDGICEDCILNGEKAHAKILIQEKTNSLILCMQGKNSLHVVMKDLIDASIQCTSNDATRLIILNQENGYKEDIEIENGVCYFIDDVSQEYTFRLDGTSERSYVKLIGDGKDHIISICKKIQYHPTLTLSKKIYRNGMEMKPQEDERFEIVIQGNGSELKVVLDKDNDFEMKISHLLFSTYEIVEENKDGYEVFYRIDGGIKTSKAIVDMCKDHVVEILNEEANLYSSLRIEKWIKEGNGTLIKPADGDRYSIRVSSSQYEKMIELNGEDQFQYTLDHIKEGIYRIEELSQGYSTSYEIDGEIQSQGILHITNPRMHVVKIINELSINQNTIEIFKYFIDQEGNYVPPKSQERFQFEIIGNNIRDIYTLEEENTWRKTLTTYPSGEYEIREIGNHHVQYLVNSQELLPQAKFQIGASDTMIVGMINQRETIQLAKVGVHVKVQLGNRIVNPNRNQSFMLEIQSSETSKYIVLDQNNAFMESMELEKGEYRILEKNGNSSFVVRVDGREVRGNIFMITMIKEYMIEVIFKEEIIEMQI